MTRVYIIHLLFTICGLSTIAIVLSLISWCARDAFGAGVDLPLLRSEICRYETRGETEPDIAKGLLDELGRCQVRLATVRALGFTGKAWQLFNPLINALWADEVIRHCIRKGRRTVSRLAHCYNAGPRASFRRTRYVRDIAIRYAEAVRDRQWREK